MVCRLLRTIALGAEAAQDNQMDNTNLRVQ
jgi:hypothetical protein